MTRFQPLALLQASLAAAATSVKMEGGMDR